MYKSRLKKWDVKKNINREEARARLLRFRTHGVQANSPAQTAELERTVTYLHRLPVEQRNQLLGSLSGPSVVMAYSHSIAPPGSLRGPEDGQQLEDCLRHLDSYVAGSSDDQLWPRDSITGFKNEDIVPSWCSSVMSAAWVLGEGKLKEATRFMGKFLDQCPTQLQRHDPLIFPFMYTSVLFFAQKWPGTARFLLHGFVQASESLPWADTSHPLRRLIQLLYRLGPHLIHAHAGRILPAYISMIQANLGGSYPIVQDMLSDTMGRLLSYDLASADAVADMGCRMASAAVAEDKHRNPYYLNLQLHLSNAYLRAGRYPAAREAAMEILSDRYNAIRNDNIRVSVNMTLCKLSEAEGRYDDAVHFAEVAVEESEKQFGEWSDWKVNSLIYKRRCLERLGKEEEAQNVTHQINKAIKMLMNKTEELALEEQTQYK